jgi:hypothetical protein
MAEKVSVETEYHHETLTFKGRLLPKLPSHYVEPSSINPLIVPHGAMPANPFLDDAVKKQQQIINREYFKLYQTPPKEMPRSFVEYVVTDDYVIHEQRRSMENFEGFMEFDQSEAYVDPSLQTEKELFERGQAMINESAHFVVHSPIRKGEFGKVLHPYGYRMQEIEPFRTETNEAIELLGGVVYPTISPYRSIKILPKVRRFDNGTEFGGQEIVGFIVKYKRDYGHILIPDSDNEVLRIVERQIAAYRVDEASGFDQKVLQAMHDLRDTYPKRIRWDQPQSDDVKANEIFYNRLKMTGCAEFIEHAVQTDALDDFVVPISTTIYGYKEKLPEKPPVDHMAHKALELSLNRSLDAMPGAYTEQS